MVNRYIFFGRILCLGAGPWRVAALVAPLILQAIVGFGPAPASAADSDGNFKIFGSGELPCSRWLEDRRDGTESGKQSEMWVAGYLSAVNEFVYKGADITEPYDGPYVLGWLDSYCQKHPSHTLGAAAHELLVTLRRRQ